MGNQEERAVPIPVADASDAAGLVLEGLFIASAGGDGGAVVAPPHPLYGGSMESPVVTELAWGATQSGLASLRFNWRGVGASGGTASGDLAVGQRDYEAALEHMAETVPGDLVATGYSFGAGAALAAGLAHPRVRRLVLVAPPPATLPEAGLRDDQRALVLTGEHDAIAPPATLSAWSSRAGTASFVEIPGADHFFGVGLAAIARETAEWLAKATVA
jgi:hypothetical protein